MKKNEDIANIDDDSGRRVQTKEAKERRLKGAYNLLEANSYEPIYVAGILDNTTSRIPSSFSSIRNTLQNESINQIG